MKRIKLKWKIYFVIGLVAAAIALMAVLIALDNGKNPGETVTPGTSESDTPPVVLPTIPIPLG